MATSIPAGRLPGPQLPCANCLPVEMVAVQGGGGEGREAGAAQVIVELLPDSNLAAEVEATEKTRLSKAKADMTPEQIQAVIKETQQLKLRQVSAALHTCQQASVCTFRRSLQAVPRPIAWPESDRKWQRDAAVGRVQETPDPPEALGCIPGLSISDIPKDVVPIPTDLATEQVRCTAANCCCTNSQRVPGARTERWLRRRQAHPGHWWHAAPPSGPGGGPCRRCRC